MADREKQKLSARNLSKCHFVTTDPIWPGLELNHSFRNDGIFVKWDLARVGVH
jgi:hypothetical protein